MQQFTAAEYAKSSTRRFGTANPEQMHNPVWEWMVRMEQDPFGVRKELGLETSWDEPLNPDWCFLRFGAPRVRMPDGRVITIAGEHEDSYDPDFCIYNDVIVQSGDSVEIYGYPREAFPPTDFHTATLIGDKIYLIGSLGYKDERGGAMTPVFRLDTNDYHIERVETTGDSPGWLHMHRAAYQPDLHVIEITGGECVVREGDSERFRYNFDTYHFNVEAGIWQRITHSEWRQFWLACDARDKARRDMESCGTDSLVPKPPREWLIAEVNEDDCEDEYDEDQDEEEEWEEMEHYADPGHAILSVDAAQILCKYCSDGLRISILGQLEPARLDEVLAYLKKFSRSTNRIVTKVVEL